MNRAEAKRAIKDQTEDILERWCGQAKEKVNGRPSFICPKCHHGKNGDGITMNPKSGTDGIKCFSCGFSGDIFRLYQETQGCSFPDALNSLSEIAGIVIDDQSIPHLEPIKKKSSAPVNDSPDDDFTEYFRRCRQILSENAEAQAYLAARGISLQTAESCWVGFDPNWRHPAAIRNGKHPPASPRMIIPSCSSHYVARDIRSLAPDSPAAKYTKQNVGSPEIFNASVLNSGGTESVFVTEGVFDALSLLEVGADAIALNSAANAEKLIESLKKRRTKASLLISLDNDNAGQKAARVILDGCKRLNIPCIKCDICRGFKDPNEALVGDRDGFAKAVLDAKSQTASKPDNIVNYIDKIFDSEVSRFTGEIKTGFENLDKEIGGLYPGLYVVAAISSLGKTTFVHQMADQIAKSGNDVLFFSLEQSRLELVSKSLNRWIHAKHSKKSKVNSLAIRKGLYRDEVAEAKRGYIEDVGDRLSIIEGNFVCDVDYITQYVRNHLLKNSQSRPVVVIDYLQILQPGADARPNQGTRETVDSAVTQLKRLSRDLDIPVIVISSVNRANYLTPIDFESLKESGGIEYTCDVVWGLQLQCLNEQTFERINNLKEKRDRVNAAKEEEPRQIQLSCLKNRYGRATFKLAFNYYPAEDLFTTGTAANVQQPVKL